jgi:hypothetical protein
MNTTVWIFCHSLLVSLKPRSHDWYIWRIFVTSEYLPSRIFSYRLSVNVKQFEGCTNGFLLIKKGIVVSQKTHRGNSMTITDLAPCILHNYWRIWQIRCFIHTKFGVCNDAGYRGHTDSSTSCSLCKSTANIQSLPPCLGQSKICLHDATIARGPRSYGCWTNVRLGWIS